MKKMRKIFAVLLTLAMVLTMSMTAFATSNANAGNDNILEQLMILQQSL